MESALAQQRAGDEEVAARGREPIDIVVAVVVGLVAVVVSWLRLPVTVRDTMWAEDGERFLQDALDHGPFHDVFVAYDGYLHLIPRLVSGVVVSFAPPDRYALAVNAGAVLVVGVVSALVYVLSGATFPHRLARIAAAAVTFLAPIAPVEVLGNLANAHWYLLWLAPWLYLYRPRTRVGAVGLALVGLVAALTEIQLILFVPLWLWRWSDARVWVVRSGVLVGLAAQVITTVLSPRPDHGSFGHSLRSTVNGYLLDTVATSYVPPHTAVALLVTRGWIPLGLLALPFVAAFLLCLRYGDPRRRLLACTLLLGSGGVWVLSYWSNPLAPVFATGTEPAVALPLRYGLVPQMFLLAVVVTAASVVWSSGRRVVATGAGLLVAVLLVVQVVPSVTKRDQGPQWEPQLDRAERVCATGAPSASQDVPIAPDQWFVRLSCRSITS